jgi:hypothetical protein
MAKKTHEEMLNTLAIKEMQIKTMLRVHLIPVRIPSIKNINNSTYGRNGNR